jgi:hypothetical protein
LGGGGGASVSDLTKVADVSSTHSMPEEKHEQSSPPSALHDTSNVSPLPCSSLTASPCCSDQMDTFPPSDPVATYSPLGLGARLYTGCVCLHRSNIISPDAPDHTFTVPSNEAVQSWLGWRGFLEPGPVGVQRRVNISFRCPRRSNLRPSSAVQIFAVLERGEKGGQVRGGCRVSG